MNTIMRPSVQRALSLSCTYLMLALVGLPSVGSIQAQSVTATLVGTVSDQSAAAIPKASLTLTMVGTNVKHMVLSGDTGDFTIAGLSPGTYLLVVSHEGFKQTVMEKVELLVNQTARVNVVLQVGTVAES